jgi:D-alanyl-D-alanine carboxypeptidase
VLSVASRREMTRRQWREPHASVERWYGLGTMSGTHNGAAGAWDWFGHTGGFPGTLTRTACVPAQGLAMSLLTNAADGPAGPGSTVRCTCCRPLHKHGAPSASFGRLDRPLVEPVGRLRPAAGEGQGA